MSMKHLQTSVSHSYSQNVPNETIKDIISAIENKNSYGGKEGIVLYTLEVDQNNCDVEHVIADVGIMREASCAEAVYCTAQ